MESCSKYDRILNVDTYPNWKSNHDLSRCEGVALPLDPINFCWSYI